VIYGKPKKDQVGTWLIPVINPYAENPLDPKLLLKNVVLPSPSFRARHLSVLPIHIYIPKLRWMDLIQLELGFKLTYIRHILWHDNLRPNTLYYYFHLRAFYLQYGGGMLSK